MSKISQFERPAFFSGRLLTAEDLHLEQQYLVNRFRRHNRFLQGWGVVYGLHVSVRGSATVAVSPGVAIDCEGNDLVCETPQKVPISRTASRLYVAIRFHEHCLSAVPTLGGDAPCSRIGESVLIELLTVNPSSGHRGAGRGTPGCGTAHPVYLATLRRRDTRWRVIAQAGRPRGRR